MEQWFLVEDQGLLEQGEAFMKTIIGCDFHPSWQQVTIFDAASGEVVERKLVNGDGEAERFYRGLSAPARVGTEACGNSQWLIDLLERLGDEVWVGDAAKIRASGACPEPAEGCASKRPTSGMLRTNTPYPRIAPIESSSTVPWSGKPRPMN